MVRRVCLAIASVVMLAGVLQAAQPTGDEAAVRAAVTRFHNAVTSGDGAAAMAVVGGDAVFLEAGSVETRAEYEKNHLPADMEFEKSVPMKRGAIRIVVSGDAACGDVHDRTEGNIPGSRDRFDWHRDDGAEPRGGRMANPRRLVVVARAPRGEVGQVAPPSVRGHGLHAALDRSRSRRRARDRGAARGVRRRRHAARHRGRVLPRRRRDRAQRAADRPRARHLERRSLAHRRRHQGRADAAAAAAGCPTAARGISPRRASQPARARRRAHRSLSAARARSADAARHERARARRAEARRPHRRDRLCNVTVGQIEEARRIAEIDAVQVELSVWHDATSLSGVVEYCVGQRHPLLAYRPLGGGARAGGRPRSRAARGRGASRRDAVRDRAGVAVRPLRR